MVKFATPQPICNCDDVLSVAQDTCVTYEPTVDVLGRNSVVSRTSGVGSVTEYLAMGETSYCD